MEIAAIIILAAAVIFFNGSAIQSVSKNTQPGC